jgi:AraC-like DNA-binding protein
MFYKEFNPHSALKDTIKCFWVFENDYGQDHFERMIPDGFIDFVYHYGERPKLIIGEKEITKPCDFLGGHLTDAALLKFSGCLKMFGIKFYPWASAILYPMPAFELNNLRISASDIMGKWVTQHISMMKEELNRANYKFVILQLENIFLKKLLVETNEQTLLKLCFERIFRSKGQVSIVQMSNELRCSPRYIQKTFQSKKGKPFQYYCRLNRLHHAIHKFTSINKVKFTEVAYENGYFDQSHFIKDFTRFTGLTPSSFFSRENIYISQNTRRLFL